MCNTNVKFNILFWEWVRFCEIVTYFSEFNLTSRRWTAPTSCLAAWEFGLWWPQILQVLVLSLCLSVPLSLSAPVSLSVPLSLSLFLCLTLFWSPISILSKLGYLNSQNQMRSNTFNSWRQGFESIKIFHYSWDKFLFHCSCYFLNQDFLLKSLTFKSKCGCGEIFIYLVSLAICLSIFLSFGLSLSLFVFILHSLSV